MRHQLVAVGVIFAGAVLAIAITIGFASPVSATPQAPSPEPVAAVVEPISSTPAAPIGICMMPGDTIELRAGIGAVIGVIAGLPLFIMGAIPGALIGAGFGALSHIIASWSVEQMGGCHP